MKLLMVVLLMLTGTACTSSDYPTKPDEMDKLCQVMGETPNLAVPPKDRLWASENCTSSDNEVGWGRAGSPRYAERIRIVNDPEERRLRRGNQIEADVYLLKGSALSGQQISITNQWDRAWNDVVVTLDGTWRHSLRSVRPGEQVVLSLAQFERNGETAPRGLQPLKLVVECAQGRAPFDLR